ncbi:MULTISPECIES: sortase [Bacillus]|uniref:Sortase n=2 Tax=Bacillus thuringiensis TaxID=1428 RepID=A0AAP4V271_BACTU|nr:MULTISPECIES: sortase [Bacillus]MEC0046449.1 sortase [Bacillus cereus]AFV21815.1 sortase [Bacillus thuringiensis Bt407]ERI01008.1 Sortase (surface protein transpeptidase) [Bacillus thuringiensis T01-328]MBN6707771.1 sortase [Bacillus thuringiensis]MDN7078402.1 sortase [Bacillus thuringiensis]
MKKILRVIVNIILLVVVIVVVAGTCVRQVNQTENNQKVEILEEAIDKHQVSDEIKEDVKDVLDTFEKEEYLLSDNSIGILEVPKLNYKASIGEGTNFDKVDQEIGHIKDTALPGQKGNVLLEGSTHLKFKKSILELSSLEKEDSFIIKTLNGEFRYVVLNKKIVPKKQVIMTGEENMDESMLTILINGNPEEYLVIHAKLL